ncbi:sulfite exporter TauE/SafE family protein [Butyrivibrio sp. VCB2006]|uniref:sulfite exporter TauE/SafE family protein n=1 Tax=Butyrivibrio sp. VCB2006 TaxID=1280679 RepID=UPI000408CDE2|nr:sulfite exporter TauE/SafE family protein [Butyrivibrio sp. VCB2006]
MDDIWFWIVATVAAYYIKGLCGFANTLVFTSIMAFGANNVNISPVELVLGFPSNLVLTFKNRKKLNHKVWIPLAILVLVGSVPGALMLKNIDVTKVKIFFGIVVVLLGIEMLLREKEVLKVRESYFILMVIGIMSGVLCGLFGVGALLAAYVGRVTKSSDEFKANISAVFIVDNIFRMILYSILGIISFSTLKSSAILMPIMLLGLFAGIKSSQILDEKKARHLVIVLLIISGISMVILNI